MNTIPNPLRPFAGARNRRVNSNHNPAPDKPHHIRHALQIPTDKQITDALAEQGDSRIPTYHEDAAAWAEALQAAGLAFHLEDDPAEIYHRDSAGQLARTFTDEEAEELRNIVARMDGDEMEVCFSVFLAQGYEA